jgi:hypothetical protein
MVRVLIADNNLDSHELIDDLIEITFRDVAIERALTKKAFLDKIGSAASSYNLILFNLDLDNDGEEGVLHHIEIATPHLRERMVFIVTEQDAAAAVAAKGYRCIFRPFSLDHFSEVVKEACG